MQDTDTFHGKQIVGSIAMVVNTTKKCGGSVFPYELGNEIGASGMLLYELSNVVNKASNEDQWSLATLLLI